MAEDKLIFCDECFAVVVDYDKHKEWHGTSQPEPSAEERVNAILQENEADYRWQDRRQVNPEETQPYCIHYKNLAGECSVCARNSITSGV